MRLVLSTLQVALSARIPAMDVFYAAETLNAHPGIIKPFVIVSLVSPEMPSRVVEGLSAKWTMIVRMINDARTKCARSPALLVLDVARMPSAQLKTTVKCATANRDSLVMQMCVVIQWITALERLVDLEQNAKAVEDRLSVHVQVAQWEIPIMKVVELRLSVSEMRTVLPLPSVAS